MASGVRLEHLPVPEDDGAAVHLPGTRLPSVALPATDGSSVRLDLLVERTVIFVVPSIGGIDPAALEEWTAVPGARGCTPEACGFRDREAGFRSAGAVILGLSGQSQAEQQRVASELQLPYRLLSDEGLKLADLLQLPTFRFQRREYFKRLTLIASAGAIDAVLYPVFPPDKAAEQALYWLRHGGRPSAV